MPDRVRPLRKKSASISNISTENYSRGLHFPRLFTTPDVNLFDTVDWTIRTASIVNENGAVIFEQKNVEAPVSWSDLAVNVVASRYFRGKMGSQEREAGVKTLLLRVVDTITTWGKDQGYFAADDDAESFHDELLYLLLHQMASFNSPVWFNVGVEERPQCSACFILDVEDTMESILNWYTQEGMIFKGGSGSGINVSKLRSSRESLSGGGTASGPISFMKAADASAGVIKSGGKTRRAAKMVILNVDHPDIVEFINCKASEERKAQVLIRAGYDSSLNGAAYSTIAFQNANHSVRVSDDFMDAVVNNEKWRTKCVVSGANADIYDARDLFRKIAQAAHLCGDPGMQFDTTINNMHTCPETGPIEGSNPCSEYMHVNNSACNLASLRLTKFLSGESFAVADFRHAVEILITAQDIIIDKASYPTKAIAKNSSQLRALGLGYADLGALLMSLGLGYDSDEGRTWASGITALMTGSAYIQSTKLAAARGPFKEFRRNREPMLKVIRAHRKNARDLLSEKLPEELQTSIGDVWDKALALGEQHGFANCQVSVLPPTGTIAFMMDCDTTGVEPEIALVKYKKLSGGGRLKIINKTVEKALKRLNYSPVVIQRILEGIEKTGTIEGIKDLVPEHLHIFDCAFKPLNGSRYIGPEGHVRMLAAIQPFISGAISKTVNLPSDVTVEQVEGIFMLAWRLGLKSIAVYRDGCKLVQPIDLGGPEQKTSPIRKRLPVDCKSERHKFQIAGQKGYLHVGFYEDGRVGEIFIRMAKEGSTISGLMDTIATLTSIALQYGVPLEALVNKFSHTRFEPSGFTSNPKLPIAKSLIDYIFRYLGLEFLSKEGQEAAGLTPLDEKSSNRELPSPIENGDSAIGDGHAFNAQSDAPACADCGAIMVRNGSCYKCVNCGWGNGCS